MMPLVLKDFSILKNNIRTLVLLTAVLGAIFIIQGTPVLAIIILPLPLIYSPINRMLYDDEKNNTLRIISSFPIRREWIVYSRYITVGILYTVITCLQLITGAVFIKLGYISPSPDGAISAWESLLNLLSGTLVPTALFISIYLPIAFGYGYIKAASFMKFIFIGYIMLFSGAAALLSTASPNSTIGRIVGIITDYAKNTSPLQILIISFALSALLLLISMEISAARFKKRNLF